MELAHDLYEISTIFQNGLRKQTDINTANYLYMADTSKTLTTCEQGHTYYKTANSPACPACEELKNPKDGFPALLGAPARNALLQKGIRTLAQLSTFSEREILQLHGIGKTSIPILKKALAENGLSFNESFLSLLSNPAKNALEHKGIKTLEALSTYSETEILGIHGIGKASLPTLQKALAEKRLAFKSPSK